MAQKKMERRQRYFGLTKIRKGEKVAWISKHDKNGWSLGLALGKRTVWLTGIRFKDEDEINRALGDGTSLLLAHMKNDPEYTG